MGFVTYRVNKSAIGFSVEPYPGAIGDNLFSVCFGDCFNIIYW